MAMDIENGPDIDSQPDMNPEVGGGPGADSSISTTAAKSFTSTPSILVSKKALLLMMILAIAAISIGAVTVSLFSDQHDWNSGKACDDCHADVSQEFTNMLGTPGIEPHEGMTCPDCHQDVTAEYGDEHAATLPTCISCHPTVATNISYATEAHSELFSNAPNSIYNRGPNEACIVCHTGFDVNVTFLRPDFYNFTVDVNYAITNVETSTSTHENTYTWTKTGESHTYIGVNDVSCGDGVSGCHNDVVASRLGDSGGHHTATQPSNLTHLMNTACDSCHVDSQEVADTEYHAAKNITCANRLNGCHDRGDTHVSANMTTIFNEITTATGMSHQKEGDLCWGCHSGYNWLDPVGSGGGVDTWANYTTDLDPVDAANHGTVAGTEANTHGAGVQTIQEVAGGANNYANYTVDLDQPNAAVHGTVVPAANGYLNIDEINPADGLIETITEITSGGDVYSNYTVDLDQLNAANHGTVTNTYTNIDEIDPSDGLTQTITEATTGGDVWANYTVASDIAVEGTVGGTAGPPYWQNIDENPAVGDIETIQEVAASGVGGDAFASVVGGTDTTTELINEINADDTAGASPGAVAAGDGWYTVDKNRILFMDAFNTGGMSGTVTGVMLEVQYSVEGGYTGSNAITWALNGGAQATTGITPTNGQVDLTAQYNLFAQGVTTLAQISTLDVRFQNNDGGGGDAVSFDYIKVIVTTAGGAPSLEHKWTTDSIPAGYTALNLYVRALSTAPGDDVFSVFWSNDDISYVDTGININNVAMTTYAPFTFPLGEIGVLYIQIIDDNTGDALLTTCQIDTIRLEWYENIPVVASLEHRWRTDNIAPGADTLTLFVDAQYNPVGSDDTFTIYWSTDDVTYNPTTITINTNAMATYSWNFPAATSGVLYLSVVDNNGADSQADSVVIDIVRIQHLVSNPVTASLEHRWRTDNIPAGATTLTLYVEGNYNTGSDDTFTIEWSTDDATYNPTTITINSDTLTSYNWNFPGATSGVLYLRVVDDNAVDSQADDVTIERIRIQWIESVGGTYSLEHIWRTESIPAGADDLTLLVNASRAAGDDDFDIGYSTIQGGPYTPVITVNNVALTAYSASIPVMSGPIYLNVIDTNSGDAVQQDTVSIDEIHIMWHDFSSAPGSGLIIQVWTEPDQTVNVWNTSTTAFEQVYPRVVSSCADCHDDTGTNPVPFGSGKYINHLNESISNYDYTHCEDCHDTAVEPWYPHDIPHVVDIDWTTYAAAADTNVDNAFCDVVCHYSDLDSRVPYQDASTPWMKDIFTSFTNDGAKHTTSTLIDADGTVECVDCHPDHLLKPDDTDDGAQLFGGSSIQGCGDQDMGVGGCHLVDNGVVDATDPRETPPTHGTSTSWVVSGRDDCTSSSCHYKHNYPFDPTEGHNPTAECHPSGILCGADSNEHGKHMAADWNIPDYDYNCSQCHFNSAGDQDGWYDTTYGTAEHGDGTLQVRFNTTAPSTVGIATYANNLAPAYNTTTNMECDNTYCHSDGYPASFSWNAASPEWDTPGVACGDCHDMAPTTSSHPKHSNGSPYTFNCSECHFVAGSSGAGSGWYDTTYGTSQHVDGQVQVVFNNTATGLALQFGNAAFTGVWNSGTDTCSDIFCHDPTDGVDGNAKDPTPVWDNAATSYCSAGGGGSCHGDNTVGNKPLTNNHPEHAEAEVYRCGECHWDSVAGSPSTDGTYGTASHVDGDFDVAWWDNAGAGFPPGLQTNTEWGWTMVNYVSGNTCDVYCHDAVTDDDATITPWLPNWGDATTAACDLCHGGEWADTTPIETGSHTGHLNPARANMICSECHLQTGLYLPGDNTFSHIDGQISFDFTGDFDAYITTANLYPDNTGSLLEGDASYGTCDVNDANCHPDGREWGGACHPGGIDCGADSYQHVKHIVVDWSIPDYDYNCSQCHFNSAGDQDGWYDNTYGTAEHGDGTLQVRFNTTAPSTVGIATYANALSPTYNATSNSLCANTYCHSDGNASGFSPGVTPDWLADNVGCGDCHDIPMTSYAHRRHTSNNIPDADPWYDFNCSECHYVAGTSAAGWTDTTYGSTLHVDGKVDVLFDPAGIGTYGGSSGVTPAYNGDDTCDNIYCHSNGYDIGGAGDIYFTTPAWNSLTAMTCGDCHGMPNYNDGADRELGGTVTGNSASHLKHTRNFGGAWGATRNLAYIDNDGDGAYDANEAVISDNDGVYLLDPGRLNGVGSPDEIITPGLADITRFVATDDVWWADANGDNAYDYQESICFDMDGDGTYWEQGERLYTGAGPSGTWKHIQSNANAVDRVAYMDADHDGNYDGRGGFKETIIIESTNGGTTLLTIATDEQLTADHWVLQYDAISAGTTWGDGAGITNYDGGPWWDVYFAWYDYDCSECHYNTPPTAGLGTYGTSQHVDMTTQVYTAVDPASISDQFNWGGTNPTYTAATQTCTNTWCHSNAVDDNSGGVAGVDNSWGNWAGATADWDNPAVGCGNCHGSRIEMYVEGTTGVDHPGSYPHTTGAHQDAEEGDMWDFDNDGDFTENGEVPCRTCHFLPSRADNEMYGTGAHANGYYSIFVSGTPRTWLYPGANPSGTANTYPNWECHKTDFGS